MGPNQYLTSYMKLPIIRKVFRIKLYQVREYMYYALYITAMSYGLLISINCWYLQKLYICTLKSFFLILIIIWFPIFWFTDWDYRLILLNYLTRIYLWGFLDMNIVFGDSSNKMYNSSSVIFYLDINIIFKSINI